MPFQRVIKTPNKTVSDMPNQKAQSTRRTGEMLRKENILAPEKCASKFQE